MTTPCDHANKLDLTSDDPYCGVELDYAAYALAWCADCGAIGTGEGLPAMRDAKPDITWRLPERAKP